MTRAKTDYERIEGDPTQRLLLRKEELILAVTNAISEELERQDLTKMELADRMGVARSNVTMLLAGGRNLTLGSIAHLADALGCEVKVQLVPRRTSSRSGATKARKVARAASKTQR